MQREYSRYAILLAMFATVSVVTVFAQTRTRPAPQRSTAEGSFKIKYRSTTSGQAYETTTMIKGARERSEMNSGTGMDVVSITQCDLKRTIQLSDNVKKYVITPMETDAADQTATTAGASTQSTQPTQRGGVVTYTTSAVDTGERKEMFGMTARHVKTTITIQSSPEACNPTNQRMEIDGWYVDLSVGLNCNLDRPPVNRFTRPGGCQDRIVFKRQGAARTGYALSETTTMYGPDGRTMFTSNREVVELSREPLDSALFDIPAGYTEARDMQELYGMSSTEEMMNQAKAANADATSNATNTTNAAGRVRIGVANINNKSGKSLTLDTLRDRLMSELQSEGVDAVPLNAISVAEAQMEAKAKQLDFVLFTDLNSLKMSGGKLGGIFGGATGVQDLGKTEAKVEFKLFATGETAPRLQASATAKEQGNEASVGTALDTEARQVGAAAKKKS
jgi:hypothetical protein